MTSALGKTLLLFCAVAATAAAADVANVPAIDTNVIQEIAYARVAALIAEESGEASDAWLCMRGASYPYMKQYGTNAYANPRTQAFLDTPVRAVGEHHLQLQNSVSLSTEYYKQLNGVVYHASELEAAEAGGDSAAAKKIMKLQKQVIHQYETVVKEAAISDADIDAAAAATNGFFVHTKWGYVWTYAVAFQWSCAQRDKTAVMSDKAVLAAVAAVGFTAQPDERARAALPCSRLCDSSSWDVHLCSSHSAHSNLTINTRLHELQCRINQSRASPCSPRSATGRAACSA
jgi:hypothetical protein